MDKASRLFEIIGILRAARQPVTADAMARQLGVTRRSIYRDIAALQAMRLPVEAGRGLGYVLRAGFDLPPLMFSIEETEAICVALALLERTGDAGLIDDARNARRKIAAALPPPLRRALDTRAIYAWGAAAPEPGGIDLASVRRAIRNEQKMRLGYRDASGRKTERTIRPLALIYYAEASNIVAWCELRRALRHFRTDRVETSALLDAFFRGEGDDLRTRWIAGWASGEDREPA